MIIRYSYFDNDGKGLGVLIKNYMCIRDPARTAL